MYGLFFILWGRNSACVFKITTLRIKPKVGLSPLLKVFILYPLKNESKSKLH